MSGTLWIISYTVLAATVAFLVLAVGALYRLIVGAYTPATRQIAWPLEVLRPGDPAPLWLRRLFDADRVALVVVAGMDEASEAVSAAVALAAESMHVRWRVLLVGTRSTVGPSVLQMKYDVLDSERLATLRTVDLPVTIVLGDGHVLDAVAGIVGPSQVVNLVERVYPTEGRQHLTLTVSSD